MKILAIGDGMIAAKELVGPARGLIVKEKKIDSFNWIMDKVELQRVRRIIERDGPSSNHLSQKQISMILNADIALAHYAPLPGEVIRRGKRLKIIGVCRAGYENVDVEEATRQGVVVFRVMGRNAEAVSDFTIGLLISETRNIARSHIRLKEGDWLKPREENIHDLRGRTVGIVGFGNVGRLVAKKLKAFEVKILVFDPFIDAEEVVGLDAEPTSLPELFRESDYICVHARLTEDTRGLIDERLISLMKPSSYIINTARAGLIDEDALCGALKERRITGAALDVFWAEPLPKEHILTRLENVTLTSHLAGTTIESLTRSPNLLIEDINRMLSGGAPRWVINPVVLERLDLKSIVSEDAAV